LSPVCICADVAQPMKIASYNINNIRADGGVVEAR
jgi:hypothetical protein